MIYNCYTVFRGGTRYYWTEIHCIGVYLLLTIVHSVPYASLLHYCLCWLYICCLDAYTFISFISEWLFILFCSSIQHEETTTSTSLCQRKTITRHSCKLLSCLRTVDLSKPTRLHVKGSPCKLNMERELELTPQSHADHHIVPKHTKPKAFILPWL